MKPPTTRINSDAKHAIGSPIKLTASVRPSKSGAFTIDKTFCLLKTCENGCGTEEDHKPDENRSGKHPVHPAGHEEEADGAKRNEAIRGASAGRQLSEIEGATRHTGS